MQRENTAEKSGMSFVGFSESKLFMMLVSFLQHFDQNFKQAVVFFLAELLVKTVAKIQLKICVAFPWSQKLFGSSGIRSINHKLALGEYTMGPGEFDWLLTSNLTNYKARNLIDREVCDLQNT